MNKILNSWSTYIWVIKGIFDQDQLKDIDTVLLETIDYCKCVLGKVFKLRIVQLAKRQIPEVAIKAVLTKIYFKCFLKYRIFSNKRPRRLLNFETVSCGSD